MKIGVIGAGTMGQGIAKAFAQVEGNTVAPVSYTHLDVYKRQVHETGAHSTDLQSPESVEHLCEKCKADVYKRQG